MRKCVVCGNDIREFETCISIPVETKNCDTVRVCCSCDIQARADYHSIIQILAKRIKGRLTSGH